MEKETSQYARRALDLALAIYRVVAEFLGGEVLANQIKELGNQIASEAAVGNLASLNEKITRLQVYFQIAKTQNWIRPINWQILDFEYYKLKQEVDFYLKSQEASGRAENTRIVSHNIGNKENRSPRRPAVSLDKSLNPRRKKILDILSQNGSLKMADLIPLFKNDVSERTLRYELEDMVRAGLIKKAGERKTTTYLRS